MSQDRLSGAQELCRLNVGKLRRNIGVQSADVRDVLSMTKAREPRRRMRKEVVSRVDMSQIATVKFPSLEEGALHVTYRIMRGYTDLKLNVVDCGGALHDDFGWPITCSCYFTGSYPAL